MHRDNESQREDCTRVPEKNNGPKTPVAISLVSARNSNQAQSPQLQPIFLHEQLFQKGESRGPPHSQHHAGWSHQSYAPICIFRKGQGLFQESFYQCKY